MKKLLTLVIAGVVIKYFLDSDQGKQVSRQVRDWLNEAQDTFKDTLSKAQNAAGNAASDASNTMG